MPNSAVIPASDGQRLLPDEIIWRAKTGIENGLATTGFSKFFEAKIPDDHFKDTVIEYP